MGKDPAYPLYAADFEMDTSGWDIEHIGLYYRLLNVEWVNGSLPNDIESLARIGRITPKRFIPLWEVIKIKFHLNGDGGYLNNRMELIREEKKLFKLKKSQAGKKGMDNRWDNKHITKA